MAGSTALQDTGQCVKDLKLILIHITTTRQESATTVRCSSGIRDRRVIIFAAGSMAFEEGGERINDLKLILGRVSEVATMFDDDGILIRFMNGTQQGNGIRDAASANQLISTVQFNGLTPLGGQLDQKVRPSNLLMYQLS